MPSSKLSGEAPVSPALTVSTDTPVLHGKGTGDGSRLDRLKAIPERWADPPSNMVAQRVVQGAKLDYMGHAEVTLVLGEVDPEWVLTPVLGDNGLPAMYRERSSFTKKDGTTIDTERWVLWCYLRVLGVERMCVGTCTTDKADPEKELIGDAIRNGAMRFGIGTGLWSKAERGPILLSDAEVEALTAKIMALTPAERNYRRAEIRDEFGTDSLSSLPASGFQRAVAILGAPTTNNKESK